MAFFKSVLVGIIVGLVTAIAWILMKAALSMSISEGVGSGAGVGSVGFAISEFEILLAAIVGYCAGFWQYRRRRR